MKRSTRASLLSLLASCVLLAACSDDNKASAPGNTGGTTTTTDDDATAGTTSTDGSGGSTDSGSGGTTSAAGTTGSGATTNGPMGDPPCTDFLTAAGEEPKKSVVCTDADVQMCWRSCGPTSVGWKTETCTGGVYAEGDCQFPAEGDYSCFAIPAAVSADCPTDVVPQATQVCDVPTCTVCNLAGMYATSTGDQKEGYCVCQEANEAGERLWTCASATAWPCPLGNGCT